MDVALSEMPFSSEQMDLSFLFHNIYSDEQIFTHPYNNKEHFHGKNISFTMNTIMIKVTYFKISYITVY